MEKIIDMHIHTTYSDGEFTPDEVIKRAINLNVGTMAITDHDTINGVKSVHRNMDFIKKSGINVINGIEVSCKVDRGNMHVLGYDFDIYNKDLNDWLEDLRTNRMNTTLSVMEQIKRDYGIVFNYQDIIDLINKNNIGRPDLAKLCIKYGFCSSVNEAFKKYLTPAKEKIKGNNKQIEYKECFKLIRNSGGLVVLAHPNSLLLNNEELDSSISDMKKYGLDGIEVFHSTFSEEESAYYKKLAEKYDLLMSGGSDYHGPLVKPGIEIGNLKIKKLSLVDKIKRRHY